MAAVTTGCLENQDVRALTCEAPDAFRRPKTPIVAAYLHLGTRALDVRTLDLQGVDVVNMAFTVITNNRMGLLHSADAKNFQKARAIKRKYPNIKVLVSVGGYGTSKDFSRLCVSKDQRAIFVDDAVRFVRAYGMDGLDVDWEFPGMDKNTRDDDKVNFTALIQELRTAFDNASRLDGKRYYLTVASGAFDLYLTYIETLKVASMVDYFFVMTYDFYGQWNKFTGHHTNLMPSALKPGSFSVDRIITNYVKMGVPREKLVVGAAFYGRQWTGVDDVQHGLYRPGNGVGSISYGKICQLLSSKQGYFRYWDSRAYAPYIYNAQKRVFISYEDEESVSHKVDYAFGHQLGGVMYWEYFSDYDGVLSREIAHKSQLLRGELPMVRFPGGVVLKSHGH